MYLLGNPYDPVHKIYNKNELGLVNMYSVEHSGIDEWCWDVYGKYENIYQYNPKGPSEGFSHVVRGGSPSYFTRDQRFADSKDEFLGVRLVQNVLQ